MDAFCACGHHYDDHDNGEECMAADADGRHRCPCVYFEEDEEEDDLGPQPIGGPGSYS